MAQPAVLCLLWIIIPEYGSTLADVLETGYSIRLIMECNGISAGFEEGVVPEEIVRDFAEVVIFLHSMGGMVHQVKHAQVISHLIACRVFWHW